jgi:hypothetical protein
MDRTLLVLLAEAWKTGDRADVLILVDRIKEAPPEEVVETFLAFRQAAQGAAALLTEAFKKVGEAMGRSFAGVAQALAALRLPPETLSQPDQPRDPGEGRR